MNLADHIRDIPDFPKPGIVFKDITPLLLDAGALDFAVSAEYILEYGVDALEMHADALADGARVLLHDDLLATGGTAAALVDLVRGRGAEVAGFGFLVELSFLGGRAKLDGIDDKTLIAYDAE